MQAVLVTGGAGYIGSHTCKALKQNGYFPIVLDDLSTGHRDAVKWGPLVFGNLQDIDLVATTIAKYDVQSVIHFAASAYVGESVENPAKYYRNNVYSSMCLLDAMVKTGVKSIIFSSSCATYGVPEKLPITEETLQQPINPYGFSKFAVEKMIEDYGRAYGISGVALRYFNAAGCDLDGELGERHDPETHLIPLALQATLGRGVELRIFGNDYPTPDGTCVRDYIHVSDLADAHVKSLRLQADSQSLTTLNIGGGSGCSVHQIIRTVEKITGKSAKSKIVGRRAGDPPMLVADCRKAEKHLSWKAQHSNIEVIVDSAWRWMEKNQN